MATQGKVGFDALLQGAEPQLVEPRRGRRGARADRDSAVNRTAPQSQRRGQRTRGVRRGVRSLPDLLHLGLEPGRIDLSRGGVQKVARRNRAEPLAQRPPQNPGMHVEAVARGGRRSVSPELVNQLVAGDRAPGIQQQVGEEGAWLGATEGQQATPLDCLDLAENPELHRAPLIAPPVPKPEGTPYRSAVALSSHFRPWREATPRTRRSRSHQRRDEWTA